MIYNFIEMYLEDEHPEREITQVTPLIMDDEQHWLVEYSDICSWNGYSEEHVSLSDVLEWLVGRGES